MHPNYRSDKPGIAPDCGMQLVPVYANDAGQALLDAGAIHRGSLHISLASQQLYGIRVAKVEKSSGKENITAFGRVTADDTKVYRLNLSSAGFVKETQDDAVGSHVKKNQRLAVIYSSELLYAAAGYLAGNARIPTPAMRDSGSGGQTKATISAQADYLRNLGMSDPQIAAMNTSRKVPDDVDVVSPVDGFILSRNISPGLRFEKNTEFYSIADLSHVWVNTAVFGQDAEAFRPGAMVRVILPETGQGFHAHVSQVLPEIDPATRALNVRLEVDNPGFQLRPDMFVRVELSSAPATGLTVPSEALLDSGTSNRVFVETEDGFFESRTVETGWRRDGRVQIIRGLRDGEQVVAGGTFLVDSESRLQTAASGGQSRTGEGAPGLRKQ
jgi:Cu(I)/Ag(I) efflux system membrane fusion protein